MKMELELLSYAVEIICQYDSAFYNNYRIQISVKCLHNYRVMLKNVDFFFKKKTMEYKNRIIQV